MGTNDKTRGNDATRLIGPELEQAINAQIGREFGASLQYVGIATYFDAETLPQLAAFFYRQADEENEHAMKFVRYVVETGGQVRIDAIPAPRHAFASAEDAVALALRWELDVTDQINKLMDVATSHHDYLGQSFLQWFVTEQLEEVSTMSSLLNLVQRAGPGGLLHVEAHLGRASSAGAAAGESA